MDNKETFIDRLTLSLVESYNQHTGQETACPDYLPDRAKIIEIIHLLRRILFPGYFEDDDYDAACAESHTRTLLEEAETLLTYQICRALNTQRGDGSHDCEDMYGSAQDLCCSFLDRLPALRDILLTDVQAAYDGDPAACSKYEVIFAYPGILAVTVYRLAHELHLLSVPLIPRIMTEYAHSRTGIDIHPGADIGRYFFIDHGTGVVIGETTEIGDNVKLYQGVTLGALSTRGGQSRRGKKRHPKLEDDVTVYSGATVLGGDTVIGTGAIIGGNTFIIQPVPPYTRVNNKDPEMDIKSIL